MKIVSGILKPTKGTVETCGSIAPLIPSSARALTPTFPRARTSISTARSSATAARICPSGFDEIIEFAELQDFVDTAVKNYSSGMVARLGFAIATMNVPDILIIDEILAVGDYKFQEKSFARMQEMIASGATVVFRLPLDRAGAEDLQKGSLARARPYAHARRRGRRVRGVYARMSTAAPKKKRVLLSSISSSGAARKRRS